MNEHALRVLEFDKVRDMAARHAASEAGRDEVLALLPSADRAVVAERLAETRELMALLAAGEHPPLDGIPDVRPSLAKLGVAGMTLRPAEVLGIAEALAAGRRLGTFARRVAERAPLLSRRAAGITPLKHVEEAVHAAVDEAGEVKDSASPELRRVRKLVGRTRDGIIDRLTRFLRGEDAKAVVQEQLITVRDDRYVMPLKPNFRQTIKGVVHGRSGSRATLFVEPLEVVEQNNRLAELRAEEREETERILRALTELVARDGQAVEATFRAIASIDAVTARARYGAATGGVVAELSNGGLSLRAARHPLIVARARAGDAVPNDIDLSGSARTLIISGPNAGGKTVILKTIGLLCLLSQSGLPVTAAEGTVLPVLSGIFADIGDEQSLEQDLSTFSSHVVQIAVILRAATEESLVLLDELGAGTDPAEGAAFGAAVLARLLERGCLSVVTTHHGGLKLFGARTEGAMNGAMEFDPGTLRPTYRFIPGRPGRSYGLDMASRLGVPEGVVADARSRLTGGEAGLDRLLEQLEEDGRRLSAELQQAAGDRQRAEKIRADAEQLHRAAAEEERSAKAKARLEARDVIDRLRQKLKELSKIRAVDHPVLAQERREVDALARRLEPAEDELAASALAATDVHPGDRVRLPRLKKTGTVLFASQDVLEVEADGVKLKVPLREAVLAGQSTTVRPGAAAGWSADLKEREGLPDRITLLGLRVDDALLETEKFLDNASVQGFRQVIIIHGLGTGALKAAVTGYLKGHPLVASFRTGGSAEGGAGVTVVELK